MPYEPHMGSPPGQGSPCGHECRYRSGLPRCLGTALPQQWQPAFLDFDDVFFRKAAALDSEVVEVRRDTRFTSARRSIL